jgi:hypothetical protein
MKNTAKINQSTFSKILCSLAIVVLWAPISIKAVDLPDTAKLVPPETILLVDIGNFSQLRTQFEKTNFYKLYKDPSMAAFVEDFKTKWREKVKQMNNELVRTIFDTKILPQGRVGLAVVLNEKTKDTNEPQILFITQWGQSIDKIKEAVDKMVQKAIENGAYRKAEDYRGVNIITIARQPASTVSYYFADDCLVGSTNLDILKFIIAHIQGATSPTLASYSDYTNIMKATGPYHDIDLYVNLKRAIEITVAEDTTGKAKTTLMNLGLDNITSLSFSSGIGRKPDSSFCGIALLKIDGAKRGIFKMLDLESAGISPPAFISASTYSVVLLNLNIKKMYDELYNILYSFDPQAAALMQMPLLPPSPQGEPGVQLKADIIDHLGSQIVTTQSIEKQSATADAQTPPESLVALAVTNRSALEKSLSLVHSKIAPDKPEAKRELLGHTMYLVDISALIPSLSITIGSPSEKTPMQANPPAMGAVATIPKMAFTITDTHLVFGAEAAVEGAIRRLSSPQTASLSSAMWFNKAKSAVPSVVGLTMLQNSAASTEISWRTLKESVKEGSKSTSASSSGSMTLGIDSKSLFPHVMFPGGERELFNFGLLPEFDAVRKYFGLSAFYGASRPDGFYFEFKYINPGETSN